MPTANIEYTPDFVVAAWRQYRRQHRSRHVGLVIKLMALAVLSPLTLWMFWYGHVLVGLCLAAVSVFAFFTHRVDCWRVRRSAGKSPHCDEHCTIELTDAGLHSRSSKAETKLQWSAFTKVVHFTDGFMLFQGPQLFHWIPLSSLNAPSEAVELETLLRSKVQEHRIIGRVAGPNQRPAAPEPQS